jgi:lipoate-protein ligase A
MLRIIIDGARDPQYNMAIDEAILNLRQEFEFNTLRIYMWIPSGVTIGRNQNIDAVKLNEIKLLGYKLVRRPTGGGALLHPQDYEITYSVVLAEKHPISKLGLEESASAIAKGIVNALKILGIKEVSIKGPGENVKHNICYLRKGSSDVILYGKKVSGSAQFRKNGLLLQHGTVLLKFDPQTWLKVINIPSEKLNELLNNVSGIYDLIGKVSLKELINALIDGFTEALGEKDVFKSSLTSEEIETASTLLTNKYSNDKWNIYGIGEAS